MADVFRYVLDISLAGSVLAILALAARLVIGRRPSAMLPLLSALIVLRLMIPVTIQSPLSVMNLFADMGTGQTAAADPGGVNEPARSGFTQPAAGNSTEIAGNTAAETSLQNQIQPSADPVTNMGGINEGGLAADTPAARPLSAMDIASVIWIAGMAVMAAFIAASNIRFSNSLKKNREYNAPGFAELLEKCKEELGIRTRIEAVQLSGINTAAVYGVLQPKLLISPSFGWLSEEEKRNVLLHELSHIKRRDTFACLFITALSAVYWFNPVIWAALALARRDMEVMCDLAVLKLTQNKRSYASTLFSLAKASNTSKPKLVSALFIGPQNALRFGVLVSTDSIKRRMKMITRYKKSRLFTAVSMILVFAIAITGCTGAVDVPEGTAAGFTPPEIQGQELIASYSLDFSSVADDEARVANIKKAAETLDGKVFPHMDDSLTLNEDMKRQIDIPDALGPITEEAGWKNAAWTGWGGIDVYIHENNKTSGYLEDTEDTATEVRTQVGGGIEIAAMAYYKAAALADLDHGSGYTGGPEDVEEYLSGESKYTEPPEDNIDNGGVGAANNEYTSDLVLRMWVENNCVTAAFYAPAGTAAIIPIPKMYGQKLIASYRLDISSIAGDEARNANINKAAKMLDGTVFPHMGVALTVPGRQINIPEALRPITEEAGWKNAVWTGWGPGGYISTNGHPTNNEMQVGGGIEIAAMAFYRAAANAGFDYTDGYNPEEDNVDNGWVGAVNNEYESDLVLRMWVKENCVIAAFYADGTAAETTPTIDSDDWRSKFSDKFTAGEAEQTENTYKDANINISIEKVQKDGAAYFVADIYVAEPKYFRTAFSANSDNTAPREYTDTIAKENNAVLAINGDIFLDGTAVRNGKIYSLPKSSADVLVMYYDGTMRTIAPNEFDTTHLKEQGVYQVWSLGPMLLKGGKPMTEFNSTKTLKNPRTAVGYYEPGHYCFIVVDGRQPGYSDGLTLTQLSQIFAGLGCSEAYNLEGGYSSEMVFMNNIVNRPGQNARRVTDIIYIGE